MFTRRTWLLVFIVMTKSIEIKDKHHYLSSFLYMFIGIDPFGLVVWICSKRHQTKQHVLKWMGALIAGFMTANFLDMKLPDRKADIWEILPLMAAYIICNLSGFCLTLLVHTYPTLTWEKTKIPWKKQCAALIFFATTAYYAIPYAVSVLQ